MLPRTDFASEPYDNEMAECFWGLFPVEKAAAYFYFMPKSGVSKLIYALKYGGRPDVAAYMGRLAAQEMKAEGFFEEIDVIVPVPLSANRERERGYNQSLEIAKGVSEVTGIAVETGCVRRTTFHGSQTSMTRLKRQDNVKGAYELVDGSVIAGRHVLLIDDIVTTGATACSCAGQMLQAGDVKISVMSLGFTKH